MDKASKVADGLSCGPPVDVTTGETSKHHVDSPYDAKKFLPSAHDDAQGHESTLESESHVLKAHKDEAP